MKNEFKGKVVAITGAGGVICGELSAALAREGAKVALLDLNLEAAETKSKALNGYGFDSIAIKCDVLDKDSLVEAKKIINDRFGPIDILVNGAGGNSPKATTSEEHYGDNKVREDTISFFDLKKEGFEFVFDLNIMGVLLPTQVFASDMLGREGCSILHISSMNAFTPLTKIPAYSAAKAGVSNLTKWLAVHFANSGIRVNALAPGFFVTNQNRSLLYDDEGNPTPRTEKILNATPMGRFGKVDELVGATMFLLSEEKASFITGVVLPIDGGFSSYSGV